MDRAHQHLQVILLDDPTIFVELVTPHIRRDPVGCSVLATNLDAAVHQGPRPGSLWILVRAVDRPDDSTDVVLAGMITPPHPLWLTPIDLTPIDDAGGGGIGDHLADRVTTALARRLATDPAGPGTALPGVRGVLGSSTPFARAWRTVTGRRHEVRMRQRMYELTALTAPADVPGTARAAGADDLPLCIAWLQAFHQEAVPTDPAGDLARIVQHRLTFGGLTLWDDGAHPVSMAGTSTVVAGVARVGPVYTPPGLRGRGYGGAVTAAATRAGFMAGADRCMLFTDLANPTSNALYPRLGYRPVGDAADYAFVD